MIAENLDWVIAISAAALSGGLIAQLLDPLINRKKRALDEAAVIAQISAQLREELVADKKAQDETIATLRRVIIKLTDVLGGVFPKIEGITHDERKRLSDANIEARLAGLAA